MVNIIALHVRKTNAWQRTALWNDAIGVGWVGLKAEMERQD